MNKISTTIKQNTGSKPEHGTTQSYVIGFGLSLVFTLLPYYMVVHKTFSGTSLLAVIIGFAFFQLAVQLIFFLHLGRERGPRWNLGFLIATFSAVLVVVVGSLWIIGHLHDNMLTAADMKQGLIDDEAIPQVGGVKTGGCASVRTNHRIIVQNGVADPRRTQAQLCDSITFTNNDRATREIVFGSYPNRKAYAGKTGQTLYKGKSWTITLSQPGSYQFFDKNQTETSGAFTVTSP